MMGSTQQKALARLFAAVIGLLLMWPALGQAASLPAQNTAQCTDLDPGRGLPLSGDSLLIAETASETDDNEDGRGSGPLADLIARSGDFPVSERAIDAPADDMLAPAVRWTTPVRERGPPRD